MMDCSVTLFMSLFLDCWWLAWASAVLSPGLVPRIGAGPIRKANFDFGSPSAFSLPRASRWWFVEEVAETGCRVSRVYARAMARVAPMVAPPHTLETHVTHTHTQSASHPAPRRHPHHLNPEHYTPHSRGHMRGH